MNENVPKNNNGIKSDNRYKRFIESLKDEYWFYVHDADGILTYISPSAVNILGYTEKEFLKKEYSDFLTNNPINEKVKQKTELGLKGIEQPPYEVELFHKNGSVVIIEIKEIPVRDKKGVVVGLEGIAHDITSIKEKELSDTIRINLLNYSFGHSMKELITKFLDETEKITGSKIGFYHNVEDDQETLSLQAWSTNTKKNIYQAEGEGTHAPVSEAGIWAECLIKKESVICNDYESCTVKKGIPKGYIHIERLVSIPVIKGNKVKIIFSLGNKITDYYKSDIDKLKKLTDYIWDIIERKKAEEETNKINELFKTQFNKSFQFGAILDNKGIILQLNEKVCKVYEDKYEQSMGKPFWDALWWNQFPEVVKKTKLAVEKVRNGETVIDEIISVDKDSNQVNALRIFSPIYDEKDQLEYISVVGLDITEIKKAEEDLKQSEEKFSKSFHLSPNAITITSIRDGKIIEINKTFEKLLGYTREESIGKTTHELNIYSNPKDRDKLLSILQKKGKVTNFEIRYNKKSGETGICSFSAMPILVNNEKCLISTVEDITERKIAEKELEERLDELNRWYYVTLNREQRIIELKNEVNKLLIRLGKEKKYNTEKE